MNPPARILVAGIGNIFLGDDGFGSAVIARLDRDTLPPETRIEDFGIRGLDLAYALMEPWEFVIMVDAVHRDQPPGTIYIMEPDAAGGAAETQLDAHAMTPGAVLALLHGHGGKLPPMRVVGCEPADLGGDDGRLGLSPEVEAAVPRAVATIEELMAHRALPRGAGTTAGTKEAL